MLRHLVARHGALTRTPLSRPPVRHFYGPVQQALETKLHESLAPLHLEVKNESHGAIENESHFHVLVVAEEFEGMRMVAQHRRVNSVLTEGGAELPFHSLRITSKTPTQWEGSQTAPAAPSCKGGDGIMGKDGKMQRTSSR
jgi:BolA protein